MVPISDELDEDFVHAVGHFVVTILERSGQMPLEVQFVGMRNNWLEIWPNLARLLVKMAGRWKRVFIAFETPTEDPDYPITLCVEHMHEQSVNVASASDLPKTESTNQ